MRGSFRKSCIEGTAFKYTMQNASEGAQNFVKGLQDGTNNLDQMNKASKAAELGMKALATVGNIAFAYVISSAITMIYDLVTASDRLKETAAQVGSTFASTKSDISDYKEQIENLYQTIDNDATSYEDAYNARQELLKIQDEMISKFGKEADAVKLVTDAINGQTDSLDQLTQDKWNETIASFNSNYGEKWTEKAVDNVLKFFHGTKYQQMIDEMENGKVTFDVSRSKDENYKKFKNILLQDFGVSVGASGYKDTFTLSGDSLDDIYQKLLNIQTLSKNLNIKNTNFGDFYDVIDETKSKLDSYQEIYSQHILYDKILKSDDYEKSFKEVNEAYKKYKDAFTSGDENEIEKAKQNYAEIIQEVTEGVNDQSVIDYFNSMYPELQEVVGGWEFEVKFKAAIDDDSDNFENNVKNAIGQFDTVEDVKHYNYDAATEEQRKAYLKLKQYADDYGLTLDQLIDKLAQMGLIHTQSKSDLLDRIIPSRRKSTNDKSSKINNIISNVDENEATKWVESLTEEEAKLANSPEFDAALKKQKENIASVPESFKEAKENLEDEYKKISKWNLSDYEDQIKDGTVQTKFGNVDMDKRNIIQYDQKYLDEHADVLKSWADEVDEEGNIIKTKYDTVAEAIANGEQMIDTVYGGSDRFGEDLNKKGWEVAFTPILPDGTFLSKEAVYEYINSILAEAYEDDGEVTEDELAAIDARGRQIGNTYIKGIYAGMDDSTNYENNGNKASVIGRLMHFVGKFGAVQIAQNTVEEESKSMDSGTLSAKNYSAALQEVKDAKNLLSSDVSFSTDIDTLTKKIDEIQNVYKTLKDAIKEYNKEGYISVDTFQSIIGLGADYLKYLVDEDGNLKLNAQSLQELTIARIKDMVVAQKNKIINMATEWSNESDAAKYLKGNLDETSDSYDDLIEKRLQLLRVKWTEQLDENGNRVWTDEQIENTIAGLRKQFGSLDTVQNAAIKGIKSGFGMTGESAKDNADKIKDINKQLDDLARSEALQKLKYKFDQLEQGITKIDTALSLLNNISDLTYEDDYIGKIEIVSNQLDLATSKAQLLQNEFEQLSAEQYDTADSSNELASRMKSTADSIAENQKQIIEYGKNITSYYMSALSAINSLSKSSIERATTLIDRNIKTLSEGGLTGLEFSFAPTVPQSAIEKQRNENQSLKNEMQSYYDSVAEMQKTALALQYKEQMAENEKKRQEILKSLKEQQNDLNEHYATVEKAQETHNATTQENQKQNDAQTQENQKQNDAAIITEQQNTQTNSLNGVKTYLTQFQTMIQGFIDWLAQNPLHPTVEFTNLNDIMDSTFIDSNNGNTLNGMAYYNQKNYSDSYAGGTIATSGCGVTSAAMVATTLTGKTITPSEVAKLAKEKGYEVSEGTSWGLFNNLGSIYNFHGEEIGKDDKSILAALNSGKKVIVSEGKGTWTSGAGHIIVLAGASDGKIMVNDPYSPEKSKKLWDIGDITKTAKGAWAYYAKGTKNFGIGGENYKTEYLRNKKTGEWHEINEPTLVNTDEYDVIGEKTSAKIKQVGKPLPMYATGTPISDPKVREMVKKASQETGVPANIILAVIDQESDNTWSSGNPDSGGTSYGYMQLRTPGVLDDLPAGRKQAAMTDKYSNILEGAKFLKRLFNNYSDWTKAASAYNQGEAGFKRHGINKYGKDVVARANSTAFVQAAQDLSSISTAVQAVSTDTSDIATNTDTIATKDMKAELQNIVDSTSTPTELAKYQGDLLNYIKDNNSIQGKNNDEFLAAWEKLQTEDETAKSVLADYDKQLTDNRWSDNYNEIKDGATKYASSYAINTIKAQTGVQVNELLKQYDDEKAVLDDILKYFRERKADGASADELKVIAQTYSEQLQNVESTSDSYVSAIQSETDYLLNIAERNTKYVKDQITWQEKINEGLERQAKLTSNVNDKLSLQKDIIDGNDTKRELYQKQKDNAHRNVLDILNSDDKDYQEVLKQFQSVEPWFDATGEFSAQYEADLARLGASTPKLVPYMKQIASLIQVYKKAWYEADNEMQQTLDDTASRIDEVYATRTDKITKAISNSEWVLDMLGDGNFDLRLEETNTQLQNNLDKTVEIKKQQEYVNELYQRGSITYEQFVEKSQTLQEDLQSVYTTIKSILNSIKQIKIDTIQKNIDDINDQLEEIHDASDRITDSIDARMDVLNDEKDELDELQDKWDKVASAVKKVLSDQKELLDDEKESVSDYWDDRIKAIEKANEETDRNISLLEKQKELSEAKEQQTALIYQNGKFTYQADPKAVQDAEYALAEEQRSIKQDKAKEALEEQKDLAIKNIEDQIDAINKYQEKWDEVFDWYKNEVNEQAAYDQLGADWMNDTMALKTSILNQVGNAYKNNESIIEGSINEEIKALEKQEKALDRQVKAQERAANAKIRDYNKEIRAIEQTSDKFD